MVIFRDLTERKESELRLHRAMAEEADPRDRLEQENAYLQETITPERAHHDIIGHSPVIRQLLTQIDLVAQTDATVRLTGETGTGKALVASAIHKNRPCKRRTLIHFKCGSLAPEALEAGLFGQIVAPFRARCATSPASWNWPKPVITEGAMRRLMACDRPGKLRELHNVIDCAAIVSKGRKPIVELGADRPAPAEQSPRVRTARDMQDAVRANLVA